MNMQQQLWPHDEKQKLFKSYILNNRDLNTVPSQLVIRVHLSDESSKTMMVDERQTVRQVG